MTQVRKRKKTLYKEYYNCERCGRRLRETSFFTDKNGQRYLICKDCLTRNIDNKKRDTFDWILKLFDVPFIKNLWLEQCRKAYKRSPEKFGPASVIGNYLKVMKSPSYMNYTYADAEAASSDYDFRNGYLENENGRTVEDKFMEEAKRRLEEENLDEDERERLIQLTNPGRPTIDPPSVDDFGETKYMTPAKIVEINKQARKEKEQKEQMALERDAPSTPPQPQHGDDMNFEMDFQASGIDESVSDANASDTDRFLASISQDRALAQEKRISDALTEDDVNMLSVKWGSDYRPSEWVRLEEMYRKYTNEFEMNVDREEVLKMMCKTSLKMDQALDDGNISDYTKLQSAFDALRKSGKFTEAQNKDKQEKYLDSVGELVLAVEKEGGIIPRFDYKFETTQDKIDFTLKDMQAYTYNLVRNEMGLGNLIETYIQKLDQANAQGSVQSLTDGLVTSREEEEALGELAAEEYSSSFDSMIEAEMNAMFSDMEG